MYGAQKERIGSRDNHQSLSNDGTLTDDQKKIRDEYPDDWDRIRRKHAKLAMSEFTKPAPEPSALLREKYRKLAANS